MCIDYKTFYFSLASLFKCTFRIMWTVFLFIISLFLMYFLIKNELFESATQKDIQNILLTIGASIATILAIAFSLSIIPIQKASEAWTPAILKIYREDHKTHIPIFLICFVILIIFSFTILKQTKFKPNYIEFTAILFLALTLDYLRWYFKHVCKLLDPTNAIDFARNRAIDLINRDV